MTINTIVLLVGMVIWGTVQMTSLMMGIKYLERMIRIMEKCTDVMLKGVEKFYNIGSEE